MHIGGFTKGMDVSWLLTPEGDATRVTITHDFTLTWPLIGEFVAHRIVGQFFVDAIARRTLALHQGDGGGGEPHPPSPLSIRDEWRGEQDGRRSSLEGGRAALVSPLAGERRGEGVRFARG